jgi:hypothetical protein
MRCIQAARVWILACVAVVVSSTVNAAQDAGVRGAKAPPTNVSNKHYPTNRAPLKPSPFVRLPIGHVEPRGWLREVLVLEANGMTGRLPEVSKWCRFEGNAWASPDGQGHSPWEEVPYWLKGYGDLGYVLKDERIMAETKQWVDGILASQREDGWFGPRELLTRENGKPDLWPPMIALNVLQNWHEATGDERVLPFMANYFRWQVNLKDEDFLAGYWPKMRGGDNIESIYWLYNRTGEPWLLDLATKVHNHTADWTSGIINPHGVNITQGFREPAEYWMQAGDAKFLKATDRNYDEVMRRFGQMPGGMFVADENFRQEGGKDINDPRGGAETCSMVEMMHSCEMLTRITGDAKWADRCEDVAFNSLPAATTPDLKALHYVTCPNQVQLDPGDKSPAIQNGGKMFSYSPFEDYRCCQHNVAHGWPYFAEEAWLATSDNGLCASLYAPSEVTAKVGNAGTEVRISEETAYPFGDTIEFKVKAARPVKFPLYLRIPGWCRSPALVVAGQPVVMMARGGYFVIDREWTDGDAVTLKLPMEVKLRLWKENKNSVSVDRGPISYSLAIGEKWERAGGTDAWPEWSVLPTTPWNYGLVLDDPDLAKAVQVAAKHWAQPPVNPLNRYDVELKVRAKRIPNWTTDEDNAVNELQQGPVNSTEPTETVTLIPMGAARLRIASIPLIATDGKGNDWKKPPPRPKLPPASHVFAGDTTAALNDGKEPASSNDQSVPRFTWWDHKGSGEWVAYDFEKLRKVSKASVYWFDDRSTGGGCRVPASWKILYKDAAGNWQPVKAKGPFGVDANKYNAVEFEPVETTGLRLDAQLRKDYSGGILEWRVE